MAKQKIDTSSDVKPRNTPRIETTADTGTDTTPGVKSKRTSIIVTPEMFSQIKALADLRGDSVNAIIIEGIQRIIDENQDIITDFADYQAVNQKKVIAYKGKGG